jgi:glycosyltransferase involved in cell wall biosynthesis
LIKELDKRKRIAIVTSGHSPYDDRIFWRFGISLQQNGFEVTVISSVEELNTVERGIQIKSFAGKSLEKNDKILMFLDFLIKVNPDLIICCEPLTIIAAVKFRKSTLKRVRILSDITEYYPHQNLLKQYKGLKRFFVYLFYFLFNAYTANLVNTLIIGEKKKAKLYNWVAPLIPKHIIGYYTPKRYFSYNPIKMSSEITIGYIGEVSTQRGIFSFLEVIKKTASLYKEKNFIIKIIGNMPTGISYGDLYNLISDINNISIKYNSWVEYNKLSDALSEVHIVIDLREKNIIYNKSLPIKIFDCLAVGRPIIISNLDSLKDFDDLKKFGFVVDPKNNEEIVLALSKYLEDKTLYQRHAKQANQLFLSKYNWEALEDNFLSIAKKTR